MENYLHENSFMIAFAFIFLAIFVSISVFKKIEYFWESKRVKLIRKALGDQRAAILYYITSAIALFLAICLLLGWV
ncbi:hypothetical protein SH2C18_26250 [Clostridium sediminicola]|uniref:hypothetical protein n=1 Tax=Clostridium sediminicola TaxID=3114879 RepID=UPI0031F20039